MFVDAIVDDDIYVYVLYKPGMYINIMISVSLFAGNQRLAKINGLSGVQNDDVLG